MSDVKLRRALWAGVGRSHGRGPRAHARYAGRLRMPPKAVLADYVQVGRESETWLLESEGGCLGVLVLVPHADYLLLENVAVEPACQGRGLGRRLLEFAEAEALRQGLRE